MACLHALKIAQVTHGFASPRVECGRLEPGFVYPVCNVGDDVNLYCVCHLLLLLCAGLGMGVYGAMPFLSQGRR